MALRTFAHSWRQVESGVEQKDLTRGPMLEKVIKVQLSER